MKRPEGEYVMPPDNKRAAPLIQQSSIQTTNAKGDISPNSNMLTFRRKIYLFILHHLRGN